MALSREVVSAMLGGFFPSDANNRLPSRFLTDFAALTIVARIAMLGEPAEQPGTYTAKPRTVRATTRQ